MSFWYDPQKKQPQLWTYPIFVLVTFLVFFAFFAYGNRKAAELPQEPEAAQTPAHF